MKLNIGLFLSIVIGLALSYILPTTKIDKDVLTTLFTVSGIMFSIGMSLTVVSNTSEVENHDIRKAIRHNIRKVRNNFILCFAVVSSLYIIAALLDYNNTTIFYISINSTCILTPAIIYSIIYFIVNFIAIQSLNEEIEEAIRKERSEKDDKT